MNEELIFNTNEDIVFQIEMLSYIRFNDQIASMNENLGDIYSYKDIDEIKIYQTEYEKRLSYQAIQQLQQENTQLKQQLKDKDELLEKIKNMSEEYCSSKFIIQTYRLLHTDEERKLLESNKED